ncbi:MAG: 1-deoxy-D-xylulose-5-phosphate reductoisomerase, partial [Firmicutes bacterium]|nr:1-deoxy-D-xylulose-5-phosphate reductoisomerase [Bacillota bacterium]
MKTISVLGSTGSIGTQTLDVVRRHRGLFHIAALTAGRNIDLFREQLREFSPALAAVQNAEDAKQLASEFPGTEFSYGLDGINKIAADNGTGMVVNALVGSMGIAPTYEAVRAGKTIAFANKETLAAGGELIMRSVKEYGAKLLPVDSEHSAIFQSMQASPGAEIKRIILTASGGPFRGWSREQLRTVTKEQALHHPNWSMGPKVTIDSSTMMNKGLEVIEAYWLFGVPYDRIEVVVHPESILHSAVEFADGCVIGQMGCA